jgi:hypothetical protein
MNKQPQYLWHEDPGIAMCEIYYGNLTFTGSAVCHPDDQDMKSKLTGENLAEMRAMVAYLRHIRDNELRPQLKILYQLYYSMKDSKQYTKRSYEARMLYRQINLLEKDLADVRAEIKNLKELERNYISLKDNQHELIRNKRRLAEDNQ